MITKEQIRQLKEKIGGTDREMLSLYAHVNPATPNNHPKAITLRTRETLKSLGMPKELIEAVLAHLANETKEARTVAIFAGADTFEVLEMAVDLPVVDPTSGHIEARWGAAHLAPLLLALDEHERYGVVFVDQERWRFFEIFLGEIDEVTAMFHPLADEQIKKLEQARTLTPEKLSAHADMVKTGSTRHVLAWTHRFYKDVAARVEKLVVGHAIDRLILLGPDRDIHFLETLLPKSLRSRVVARASSLPSSSAGANEVLRRVEPLMREIESQKELETMREIRERGVFGVESTLSALQNGQLYAVVAAWDNKTKVFVDRDSGFTATAADEVRAFAGPNAVIQERLLRDVLPELAMSFAARVELVQGEAKTMLDRELGGMGGLKRFTIKPRPQQNGDTRLPPEVRR